MSIELLLLWPLTLIQPVTCLQSFRVFLKKIGPSLASIFVYFYLFKRKLQFLQQINVKNVHPVCSAGIWTHNLWNTILPTITTRPELLPQRYKPSYNAPYVNSYRNPIPMCGVITSLLNVYKAVPMYGRVFFSWSVLVARATTFTKAATMMRKKSKK